MIGRRGIALAVTCAVLAGCSSAPPTAAPSAPATSPVAGTPAPTAPPTAATATPTIPPTPEPTAVATPSPTAPTPTTVPSASPTATPSATPGESPPIEFTFTSDDGLLAIEIPQGVLPTDMGFKMTTLGQADAPPELKDFTFRSAFYRVEPEGLTLSKPVTVRRTIDLKALDIDPVKDGLPLVGLASRSFDGKWEWLSGQTVTYDGKKLTVSAQTTHFSLLLGLNVQDKLQVPAFPINGIVNKPLDLQFKLLDPEPQLFATLGEDVTVRQSPGETILQLTARCDESTPISGRDYYCALLKAAGECAAVGTTEAVISDTITWPNLQAVFGETLGLPTPFGMNMVVTVPIVCVEAVPEVNLEAFCIRVDHHQWFRLRPEPVKLFKSRLDVYATFDIAPGKIESLATRIDGANEDKEAKTAVVLSSGVFEDTLGIDAPGTKTLVRFNVELKDGRQLDLLDQAIAKLPGHTSKFVVRHPQEDTFGTCP